MAEIKLNITGMTCGGCAAAVRQALTGVAGVSAAEVDLAAGLATVTTDAAGADTEELLMAVTLAGFEAVKL